MEKSKRLTDVVLFLLIVVLLSCSENDGPAQEELPKFENTEAMTVWNEDVVKLKTNTLVDPEKYNLFVGDSRQEYTSEDLNSNTSVVFKAKYTTENENKELPVVLKDKQGKVITSGGKIKILRTYRYYLTNVGIGSHYLSTLILNDDNSFFTVSPIGIIGDEITMRKYSFFGINDSIWFNNVANVDNGLFSVVTTQFYPPATGLGHTVPLVDRNNRFYTLGFAKYGNKFYIPRVYRSNTSELTYPLFIYDGVSATLYKHNNQIVDLQSQPTDIVPDSHGNLFICCEKNAAIYKLDETNGIQLFAGSETESGYRDGKGKDARFGTPHGDGIRNMLIDSNDNLYVAEKTKIRKISPDGTVSTFIGTNESADVVGSMAEARFVDIKAFSMTKKNVIYLTEENTDYIKIIDIGKQNVVKMKVTTIPNHPEYAFNTSNCFRIVVNEQGTIFMDRTVQYNASCINILCLTDLLKKN